MVIFEQLLRSKSTKDYILELNKKYPDITSDEFCKKVTKFIEQNKATLIEEAMDFDDIFGDDEETGETETGETETGETSIEDTTKRKVAKVEKTKIKEKPTIKKDPKTGKYLPTERTVRVAARRDDVDIDDDRYIVHDGVKKLLLVNNPKNKLIDIHSVVENWYNDCINDPEHRNLHLQKRTELDYYVTTEVTDMSALFAFANVPNIDLSSWDTSNVTDMEGMFYRSTFNNDSIEDWDVSSCINFRNMFVGCRFSGDISGWTPGYYYETMRDEENRIVYKTDESGAYLKDADGNYIEKKRKIRAKLPEVGARRLEIETDIDYEIKDVRKGLGSKGRTKKDVDSEMKESKKHILTIEEFVNEGFYDNIKQGIKRGVKYIKDKFKVFSVKINDFFVVDIDSESGEPVHAVNPITTMNYIENKKPKGIRAFFNINSPFLNDGVRKKAKIQDSDERYGWMKKDSREYKNYLYFLDHVVFGGSGAVSEARISLSAGQKLSDKDAGGNFKIDDISTKQLKEEIISIMNSTPADTGHDEAQTMVVYGAPGIGKTSIPKEIIKTFNEQEENKNGKKAIIVIQCGDLELGGFNLPIPRMTNLEQTIYANPAVLKNLIDNYGFTEERIKKLKNTKFLRTFESPKTWLPVYQADLTGDALDAAQDSANGRIISRLVPDGKGKYKRENTSTTEGGIILFDEFLRADPELFKTICQLIQERTIGNGEYRLGEKWAIICCSNRPVDDTEVDERYKGLSAAMANRFLAGMYNYIPDFYDWLEWAKDDGHFDEDTLAFISGETTPFGGVNKEEYTDVDGNKVTAFKNWHTIDTDKFASGEEPIPTTPRGWSALMLWVHDELKRTKKSSIFELDMNRLRRRARAVIGATCGEAYAKFMEERKAAYDEKRRPEIKAFFTDEMYTLDVEHYSLQEAKSDIENYIKNNISRRKVLLDSKIGEKLLNMAKNIDRFYAKGEIITSEISGLHTAILQNIYRLRAKDPDSKPILDALKPYLHYIIKERGYDIDLLPTR